MYRLISLVKRFHLRLRVYSQKTQYSKIIILTKFIYTVKSILFLIRIFKD